MLFERYGHGPCAFLCLHGWNGTHATFAPLAAGLPERVSLWCPDIPTGATLSEITDSLEALSTAVPKPLRIVGNCSGALHGLLLAERVPVERLVMIDAFAYWPWYFRLFLAPVLGRYAYWSAFANPVGRWLANGALARHRTESTNLTDGFSRADHAKTYRQLELLSEIHPPEGFRGVTAQIDIVCGERSFAAIRRSAAIWKKVFPAAREYTLAGAGHLPLLEATGQLRQIILEESPCTV